MTGTPLNVLISIRPLAIDELSERERCDLFASVRNKLGVLARQYKFEPAFAWSREVNQDGTGEHLHVLMHVPRSHRPRFDEIVINWFPGAGEVDVRTANQRTLISYSGRMMSAATYIAKQMTMQAWWGRGLIRKAGGPIFGKRGGVTVNLAEKARQRWYGSVRSRHSSLGAGARSARAVRRPITMLGTPPWAPTQRQEDPIE
jgi:hypothetical protein